MNETVNIWVNNYKETSAKGEKKSYFEKYSDPNKYSLIQKLRLREENVTVKKKKKITKGRVQYLPMRKGKAHSCSSSLYKTMGVVSQEKTS